MKTALVGLLAFLILPVIAEDQTSALVLALNTAASRLVTEGKLDKAEGLYYRVLANDENCPEALYELGKMLEKQGKLVSAGEFFNHAIKQFAKIEKPNTAVVAKKQDAERRLRSAQKMLRARAAGPACHHGHGDCVSQEKLPGGSGETVLATRAWYPGGIGRGGL